MKNFIEKHKKVLKKLLLLIIILAISFGGYKFYKNYKLNKTIKELTAFMNNIKDKSELSTVEYNFENVAKIEKDKTSGLSGTLEKKRELWIIYEAFVRLGVDLSEIKDYNITNTKITIKLPEPKITSKDIDIKKVLKTKDGFWNKNEISADEQLNYANKATEDLIKKISKDNGLMTYSKNRAEKVIENKIREIVGKDYIIEFKK